MADICLASNINTICGTDIRPWEVGQLPDEWLDAFRSWAEQMRTKEKANEQQRERERIEAQARIRGMR